MRRLAKPPRGALPIPEMGQGCFETMQAYHGRIFRLDAHLRRLEASARFLGLRLPDDRRGLAEQLRGALRRSGLRDAVVRVAMIPRPGAAAAPHIVVQPVRPPPARAYARGIRVAVVTTRPYPLAAMSHQAKYSARLASVLAVQEAQLRGADEALWMDGNGYVTESTASNFGIVRRGVVHTAPCHLGLLAGITRDVLKDLAAAEDVALREEPMTRHDLYNADEAFLLSTLKEVMPVTVIDGRRIGTGRPGPISRRLQRAFRRLVREELHADD